MFQNLAEYEIKTKENNVFINYNEALKHFETTGSSFFETKGYINDVDLNNTYYYECPATKCSRKLQEINTNTFHCTNCKQTFNTAKTHILLTLEIVFENKKITAKSFNKTSEMMLGISSYKFGSMLDIIPNDLSTLINSLKGKTFAFNLKITNNKITNECQYIIENAKSENDNIKNEPISQDLLIDNEIIASSSVIAEEKRKMPKRSCVNQTVTSLNQNKRPRK